MSEYNDIIEKTKQMFLELEGKVLIDFSVDVVEPEFNIVYLIFSDCVYAINGAIGSEVITITRTDHKRLCAEGRQLRMFKPYSVFLNKKIIQVRSVGEEWNGHGLEISFEGIFDKSMIIQSIYAGDKPKQFDDCLRLGIGQYVYSFEHGEYDDDESCDDPRCPGNKIGQGFKSDGRICDLYIESNDRRSGIEITFGETVTDYLPSIAIAYRLTGDISFKHRKKVWVEIENLSEFIKELTILRDKSRGKAVLRSMSPDEFEIVLENADNSGHIILFYSLSNSELLHGKRVHSVIKGGVELETQALTPISITFGKLLDREF